MIERSDCGRDAFLVGVQLMAPDLENLRRHVAIAQRAVRADERALLAPMMDAATTLLLRCALPAAAKPPNLQRRSGYVSSDDPLASVPCGVLLKGWRGRKVDGALIRVLWSNDP